jgi:very-short-patch-repair endonuclease
MKESKNRMHLNASPQIFRQADELRWNMTKAEKLLWDRLKEKKLNGYKFRRQHPILRFIVDFYCHSENLVIELDGEVHNDEFQNQYDEERTKVLVESGLKVIRFKNEEVFDEIENVIEEIRNAIHAPNP